MRAQSMGLVTCLAVPECAILQARLLPGYHRLGHLNLVMLYRSISARRTSCRDSNLHWVRCSDRTISHSTSMIKDIIQVAGYDEATKHWLSQQRTLASHYL